MANRYWSPAGAANWGDANVWATTDGGDPTGVATPTSLDDVFFTSTNINNCVIAAAANCLSIDFTGGTGYTGTLSGTQAFNVYGNFTLNSGMTNNYTGAISMLSTAGTKTINTNGITLKGDLNINGSGGTFKLLNNLNTLSTKSVLISYGTFTVVDGGNNYVITTGNLHFYNNSVSILGSGEHILSGTGYSGYIIFCDTTVTINADTSTIKLTGTKTAHYHFAGGGKTFYNFWDASTGAYETIIDNDVTFNDFKLNAGRELNITNSKTLTCTTFTALGTSGSHIVIHNTSGTTHATLTKAGGGVISGCDYIDIQEITGSPAATWYIGPNSTDVGNTCTEIYLSNAVTTNIKTYNTNLYANIKTINTNAIANVKTLNTNA